MRLSLDDISIFSKCPRYFRLLESGYITPISLRLSIVEKIIKKAYIRRTEYEKKTEWKTIVNWVDRSVFKNVDIENDESFKGARKLSESVLVFIRKWYEFDYIRNVHTSYVDVPVTYDFGSNLVVGRVPLVHVGDKLIISYIDEVETNEFKIYNNIKVMGWACMLLEELDIEELVVRYLRIGQESGMEVVEAVVKRGKCPGVREMVGEIASSIAAGISYPSYTEMCKPCSFRRGCRI